MSQLKDLEISLSIEGDRENPFDKQSMFEVVDHFGSKLYLINISC
jgi:hypothetical protein